MGYDKTTNVKWNLFKVIEEPEFGPGPPVKTLYIVGGSEINDWKLGGLLVLFLHAVSASLLADV